MHLEIHLSNSNCKYCDAPGQFWCGCSCCNEFFMVCEDCGSDIPVNDNINDMGDKDKLK